MPAAAEELRDLIGNIGAPVFVVDVDERGICRFAAFNAPMERGTGFTTEDVAGKTPSAVASPDWVARFEPNFARCIRLRAPVTYEDYVDRPNVRRRWVSVTLTPLLRENGSVRRMVGTVHDFTGQRLAERELAERLEFEQGLTALSSDFVADRPEAFEAWVVRALETLAEFICADRAGVFVFEDEERFSMRYEWCRPGVAPMIDRFQHVALADYPYYGELLKRGAAVPAHATDALGPEAAAERSTLEKMGAESNLMLPMVVAGQPIGALGANSVRGPSCWDESLMSLLRLQTQLIANALYRHRLELRLVRDRDNLARELRPEPPAHELIAMCPGLAAVDEAVHKVASSKAAVLVTGETGVGKEVVARAIHELRKDRDGPLVSVNCAAVPVNVVESELFGHVRGAFTGADADRVGRFELADRGTLLLDEVGELDPGAQAKLLRALQEGVFERVGSAVPVRVDVRIVSATNRELARAVDTGDFRADLYYRLNVFPIEVPPLRERKQDILPLARYFLARRRRGSELSDDVVSRLIAYAWPGNARELANVIERAAILAGDGEITVGHIAVGAAPGSTPDRAESLTLEEHERVHIARALNATDWQVEGDEGAAQLLGLNPSTLRARIRKHGLTRPG